MVINFTRLKEIREDNDINQEKMANILGVKRSTYSLWELGINIIPLVHLSNFADYFNISIDYILGINNNRNSENLINGLDLKILGNNMKNIRKKNNLSQIDIANKLNVSQACVNKYEKGLINISISNLYEFSKEFNVSINELCGKTKY